MTANLIMNGDHEKGLHAFWASHRRPHLCRRAERVGVHSRPCSGEGEVHMGFLWSAGSLWLAGGG